MNIVHQEQHQASGLNFLQESLTGTLTPTPALREILLHEKQLHLQKKEIFLPPSLETFEWAWVPQWQVESVALSYAC